MGYFQFWEGLEDAAVRRIVTHRLEDWKDDMLWMILYFSFGAWFGMFLMFAPRLPNMGTNTRASFLKGSARDDVSLASKEELSAELVSLQDRIGQVQAEILHRL